MQELVASLYWDGDKFNDLFIQLFISRDHQVNMRLFNKMMESELSYKQLCDLILNISGSKVVLYRAPALFKANAWFFFTENYKYGEYSNCIEWIQYVYENTGQVLPRSDVLEYIKEQAPKRAEGSFAPVGMALHDYRDTAAAAGN